MASENGTDERSFKVEPKTLGLHPSWSRFFKAQIALRILIFMLTIAAICIMVTSDQTILLFGIKFQARYSYSSAFRFLAGVDIVICVLSLLSLIVVCAFYHPRAAPTNYFLIFLHDLIAMVLMMAGCAAATAIGYVGRYGQDQMGWTAICNRVNKFCNSVTASVALSYVAFLSLFVLTILSFKSTGSVQ